MRVVAENLVWQERRLTKSDYRRRNGHRSLLFWFTGLSGAGKSTLAHAVEEVLFRRGVYTYLLDGDNVRQGLNRDLGFNAEDRQENIRRIGEVGKLLVDAGLVTLAAFISPFRSDRDRVRQLLLPGEFVEVYVRCDLGTCEARDPKGLYKKARAGGIPEFTGISSPYEEPVNPELVVDTSSQSLEESVGQVLGYWEAQGSIL
ncbi:MAG: adenylyl-sulfate kinase [Deltaproteobacteria bacterium]|nr:adenylyl-sulfate kinase [Deltaproteobacteria bacterium]